MSEQFSRRQVELILRRTAELERRQDDSAEAITPADLEKVAQELGMSTDALKQAMAESRAGLLETREEGGVVARVFGASTIEARRFVPGDLAGVRSAVERFFAEQGFEVKRHRGETQIWEASRDFWTRVRLAFRKGSYRLPRDVDIEVLVTHVPGGPQPVLVRMRVDASRLRGSAVGGATAGLIVGAAGAVVGAVLLPIPIELATWAGGAAIGALGVAGGRSSYRTSRERLQTALERFLDFLEHSPPPAPRAKQDPISRVLEFLSGDWWQ